jgi:hypothetical protein
MNRGVQYALAALAVAMASIPADAQPAAEEEGGAGWTSYADGYGTILDFPTHVFSVTEGAPPMGSGRRFRTADGRAAVSVYTLANEEGETARSYLGRHLRSEFRNLDYNRVSGRFFAVSGIVRGKTFYSRCNFERPRGPMHCIYLDYPAAETRAWDRVVTRMSRSLRAAR